MPTIVNPYGYQTPIGSALGQMMDVFLKAPGPDEKALSAAKLSTLEESRRKTLLEADALRRKQKAGVDLSSLFTGLQGLATAPFVFADTNEGASAAQGRDARRIAGCRGAGGLDRRRRGRRPQGRRQHVALLRWQHRHGRGRGRRAFFPRGWRRARSRKGIRRRRFAASSGSGPG